MAMLNALEKRTLTLSVPDTGLDPTKEKCTKSFFEMDIEMVKETESSLHRFITTINELGFTIKEQVTVIFQRGLGSTESTCYDDGFENCSSSSLMDNHDNLHRSYGSFPIKPNVTHHPNGAEKKYPQRIRRHSPGPNYQYQSNVTDHYPIFSANSNADLSPSAPRDNKLTIPIINIEQDDHYLTVDTSSRAALSSGFNSAPPSPTPTNGGSTFDMPYENTDKFTIGRYVKIGILVFLFVGIAGVITMTSERETRFSQISAAEQKPFRYPLQPMEQITPWYPVLVLMVKGAFVPKQYGNFTTNRLTIDVERTDGSLNGTLVTEKWELSIFSEKNLGKVPESIVSHTFTLSNFDWWNGSYALVFRTNMEGHFPVAISLKMLSQVIESGAIFGGLVIIGLYILIIFELMNRTLSAMIAASASIGILALFDERPTTEEMVSWLDMETLILLFSMMVLVSILCETGFFDYCAFIMYKVTNGQIWPMVTLLCMFTAIVSAFLDNVTTILLMTPVTIRICEAMELNPIPVLISIVIFSNMGGACTPVGDPPNVIIANNQHVQKGGVDFAIFTTHMMLGIIPVIIIAYIQLRITFRSMKSLQYSEPYAVAELRREIEVWTRSADSLSSYSKDENQVKALLLSKVVHLRNKLKSKIKMGGQTEENYKANLMELKESCRIRDWPLLIKCIIVLSSVIILFFLHSIPQLNLSMGWTALLGAVLLLILADPKDIEGILSRVEWSTLIFFSALFIVMEAVSRLGLLNWIGNQTEQIILTIDEDSRLTVAILLILWVSGVASAFIDNIPFTTMMVKIVVRVATNLSLPLQPLIWALAFGTCLGGNGTIIGASANVVCAGVAEQHGYRFTFMDYFKIGFPMMIVSLIVATGYLLLCHSLFSWNY